MTSRAIDRRRDEVLRDWAEAATAKAREVSGRGDLDWKKKSGERIVRYHCPNPDGGHQWKGDDPSAWATVGPDGRIKAGCRVCAPKDSGLEDDYTATIKELIGWTDDPFEASGVQVLRWHDYDTHNGRFIVRHSKLKKKHGNADAYWGFSTRSTAEQGYFARFEPCGKGDLRAFREQHYPELATTYHMVQFYQHERFRRQDGSLRDLYRVVLMEGERDAEVFNALMTAAGSEGLIATALPAQVITSFAEHQRDVIQGRDLILIGDNDPGGKQAAEHWSAAAWGIASSVKVFPREVFGEAVIEHGRGKGAIKGRDFTEWVEVERKDGRTDREIAGRIIDLLSETPKLDEPLAQPRAWRQRLRTTQKGGVSATNLLNGKIAWTEHPSLAGRLWLNTMTAEIEMHGPPWAPDEVVAGAKRIASACSAWLDDDCEVCLSSATLEEAAWIAAEPRNPYDDLLAEPWDGTPRLDGLFTRYLPLDVDAASAVSLARIFLGDLTAKASGRLTRQRLAIGIGTSLDINIARALVGSAGTVHQGTVRDGARFTRRSKILVQTSMEPIADKRVALTSLPVLFAEEVWNDRVSMHVPSPAFIAVGEMPSDPRTVAQMSDHCFALGLAGKPMMETLEEDAPQIMAEAVARADELQAEHEPSKDGMTTLDEEIEQRSYALIYKTLHDFSTLALPMNRPVGYDILADATERPEPLDHIAREQWMLVMGPMLSLEWRRQSEIISAFNRAMKRVGLRNTVTVTPRVRATLGLRKTGKYEKYVIPGTYLGRGNRGKLQDALEGVPDSDGVTSEEPRETEGCYGILEGQTPTREKRFKTPESESFLHVRTHDTNSKRDTREKLKTEDDPENENDEPLPWE